MSIFTKGLSRIKPVCVYVSGLHISCYMICCQGPKEPRTQGAKDPRTQGPKDIFSFLFVFVCVYTTVCALAFCLHNCLHITTVCVCLHFYCLCVCVYTTVCLHNNYFLCFSFLFTQQLLLFTQLLLFLFVFVYTTTTTVCLHR